MATEQPEPAGVDESTATRRAALVRDFRGGDRRSEVAAERSRGGGRAEPAETLETREPTVED